MENIKKEVYAANMFLHDSGLIKLTWGNASQIDREKGIIVIKPSGVDYNLLRPEDMVVVSFETGKVLDGRYKPSSDLDTHIEIYKTFENINGVVHTHSPWATIFSQIGSPLIPLGTTHADSFYGTIPCTRALSEKEIKFEYEKNTGKVIAETFKNIDYSSIPGVFVFNHAPFTWGKNAMDAAKNALILEEVSMMGYHTLFQNHKKVDSIDKTILDKHYLRKHGKDAYYGQDK